jgi:hypothetical protein
MRRLGPGQYREMPWKNGGGSTTELLIHPPGATLDGGFHWRISMADVGVSGPFSPFPGVDRTLMLLRGGGMELDHGPQGVQRLERTLEPLSFSGDWNTQGRLLDGPCRDFNVLSARDHARHALTILRLGRNPVALPEAPRLLVIGLEGRAQVAGEGLEPMELLEWEGASGLEARALDEGAVVAVVEIKPSRVS